MANLGIRNTKIYNSRIILNGEGYNILDGFFNRFNNDRVAGNYYKGLLYKGYPFLKPLKRIIKYSVVFYPNNIINFTGLIRNLIPYKFNKKGINIFKITVFFLKNYISK